MSKIIPISIVQSMSGKVCEHSDMYFRTNKQTGAVSTGKVCYPSDAAPTAAQIKAKERFAKLSAAVDEILQDPEQKANYLAAYKAQHKVGSLRGYVFKKISPLYDADGELKAA